MARSGNSIQSHSRPECLAVSSDFDLFRIQSEIAETADLFEFLTGR